MITGASINDLETGVEGLRMLRMQEPWMLQSQMVNQDHLDDGPQVEFVQSQMINQDHLDDGHADDDVDEQNFYGYYHGLGRVYFNGKPAEQAPNGKISKQPLKGVELAESQFVDADVNDDPFVNEGWQMPTQAQLNRQNKYGLNLVHIEGQHVTSKGIKNISKPLPGVELV